MTVMGTRSQDRSTSTDASRHDAVVIGSGPNGLMAANLLADAGWDVVLLEAQRGIGGAVASASDVAPGFVHDTFSAFYPLTMASPAMQSLQLEQFGLQWLHAPAVLGSPLADGGWALLHRDRLRTAAGLDRALPGDGDAWLNMIGQWDKIGSAVIDALLSPFPPVKGGLSIARRLRQVGGASFVQMMLEPVVTMAQKRFGHAGAQLLLAGNAGHGDIPVNAMGSGVFGWLLTMLAQDVGYPSPAGGAGALSAAMADRFRTRGGVIHCDTRVSAVLLEGNRAVGVRTANGDVVLAKRAVIADVLASSLYGELLRPEQLPARTRRGMREFTMDPGTVKVDFALSSPIPWASTPDAAPGTVHIVDSIADLNTWTAQLDSGLVPANPFMLLGQMTTTDPTRSPAGTESIWAYTHVPQHIRGDAGASSGGSAIIGRWDSSDAERMADRMQARIERYAPGFGDRIITRRVLSPLDLEARNANLVGGAIGGGTAAVHQQLIFRPIPGLGRAETPFRGLYLGSSSAHPGGGAHGAAGSNAARAALAHSRISRRH